MAIGDDGIENPDNPPNAIGKALIYQRYDECLRDVLSHLETIDTTKLAGVGLFAEAESVGRARVLIDGVLNPRPSVGGTRPVLIAPSFKP